MSSLIFKTAATALLPVMLLLSIVVLLRGHNEPGGGFVGGLLAASGFALYSLSHDAEKVRRMLRVDPRTLIGWGLLAGAVSGIPGLLAGPAYLKGFWMEIDIPAFGETLKFGTPLLFDIGVYMVVCGAVVLMTLTLEDPPDGPAAGG